MNNYTELLQMVQAQDPLNTYKIVITQMSPAAFFFAGIGVFITSFFLHELGHLIALHYYGQKNAIIKIGLNGWHPYVHAGEEHHYDALNSEERMMVYFSGIFVGLMVILLAGHFHQGLLLILAPYIMGCLRDLQLFWQVGTIKEETK